MPKTTDCGYNTASESVNLFLIHELYTDGNIDNKNKRVDVLVDKMTDLEKFLGLIAARTVDSNRLDLVNAEDQALVDKLRTHADLHHIFSPEGKYSWKNEQEIGNLTRMVHQHVEGPLQREITMKTEEMVLDRNELTKVFQAFANSVSDMRNSIKQIIANMLRGH